MANIDTSFTKAELRLLIKLAYTGYFVCDREEDPDSKKNAADSLIDRLLQMGLTYRVVDGVEFEAASGKHYLDADHEEELLEDYGDFVEESFWDELIFRLGRRDLENLVGEVALSRMEPAERMPQEEEQMEKYRIEFEKNGIKRLDISK